MKGLLIAITVILVFIAAGCESSGKMVKDDFVFKTGQSEFMLDTDATALLSLLGDNYDYSEAPSCVYEGTDKIFAYDGIEIYTYPYGGADLIDEIVLLSSGYVTNRGVKPGDSIDAVLEKYGNGGIREGNVLTYPKDPKNPRSPVIYFVLDGKKIISIHYYSSSNITD